FRKESCYIMQDDMLNPLFTVHEIMTMASEFKLGSSLSTKAKQLVIEDILETLGLSATRDTRCCRLSGGQRKRLSIALELIDNPPVMFLDEPTTGLDSSASLQVVSTLKALARGGRTIVCTIHQPSATVFELFDFVHVIAKGRTAYQGSALNVVPFLQTAGMPCPKYHNPADF
ncbi:ABC-transporter, subfamily G member 18, partial [Frankliniella occidentalis]